MSKHVHVRLNDSLAMTPEGELVEMYRCRCGATWTKVYWTPEGEPGRPDRV